MNTTRFYRLLTVFLLALLPAEISRGAGLDRLGEGIQKLEFTIDGVERTALVYASAAAKEKAAPLVFVFHGHGGNSQNALRSFGINKQWPEAISVYMQGLNTPGKLTDPEGKKPGWQSAVGNQEDRDLKFFDAVLAKMKKDYKVDGKRIYCTGHSNGGGFTYLLWAERGDVFAAVAPSSAVATYFTKLKPKPAMHLAGEQDPLVKFEWQKKMMEEEKKINGCEVEGKTWDKMCVEYSSKTGTPFVTYIHPGGHQFTKEAPELIVKFFKEHPGKGSEQ